MGNNDVSGVGVTLLKLNLEKSRVSAQEKKNDNKNDSTVGSGSETYTDIVFTTSQDWLHQVSLKIDDTCADAEVCYPTDIDLLHDGLSGHHRYIGKLCKLFSIIPPVTNYKATRSKLSSSRNGVRKLTCK